MKKKALANNGCKFTYKATETYCTDAQGEYADLLQLMELICVASKYAHKRIAHGKSSGISTISPVK